MAHTSSKANPQRKVTSSTGATHRKSQTGPRRSKSSRTKADTAQANGTVKETALDYLRQGWNVMRLPPRSKEPYPGKSHAECAITNDNVHTLAEDENLAVVFKTADSLKDLDLDYQAAVDLAQAVGLEGAAFGRKPIIGHYLFDSPGGCEAKKFELPRGNYPLNLPAHDGKPSRIVLEIRGNDHTYTMFPPSIHPCGKKVEWVGTRREPVKKTAQELFALAGRHAVCSVVLYFYPDDASARYDVRMALTGTLLRSGMPADLVTRYVQQTARLAGDPKWEENFAERTEKRLQEDKKTTGLTKLIEVLQLPNACLGTFYEWLNVSEEEAEAPPLSVSAVFPIDEAAIPRRKWLIPGLLMRGHVTAAAVTMGADQNVLKDYVFLADNPHNIVIAQFDAHTKTMVATPFQEKVIEILIEKKIDVVWVDPFAETFAGDENSNNDLKWAAVLWREVARRTGAAVILVHHTKKYASGNMAGDADASRGAGALIGIVRVIVTIFTMTKEEAELMEIPEEQRHRYIRFDDAKANYSLVTGVARWFYKQTYTLKNAGTFIPGDDVGVLVPWEPPGLFAGVSLEMINAFYDKVNAGILDENGKPTGEYYTLHKTSGEERWLGTVIQEELHCDEARAKKILKHWKDKNVLDEFEYKDPIQYKKRKGVRIKAQAAKEDFNQ